MSNRIATAEPSRPSQEPESQLEAGVGKFVVNILDLVIRISAHVPVWFYAGFMLGKFWGWFVTADIARPSLVQFTAAWLVIRMGMMSGMKRHETAEEKSLKLNAFESWLVSVVMVSLMLLMGYVIHLVGPWFGE